LSDFAHDELMDHEQAVLCLADLLHTIAAGLPAARSLPELAEAMLSVYSETTREIVLAALDAGDPSNLANAPRPAETHRRGHLRLVLPNQ
jgi:hypothetical protein